MTPYTADNCTCVGHQPGQMNMPSPCQNCGEVVEYDDLTVCDHCKRWLCDECTESRRICENCLDNVLQEAMDDYDLLEQVQQ